MIIIPDDLIINWDHTGLSVVPTGQWTMHHVREKVVPIANVDDKRRITVVLGATMAGKWKHELFFILFVEYLQVNTYLHN